MMKILYIGIILAVLGLIGIAVSMLILHEPWGSGGNYSEERTIDESIARISIEGGNQYIIFKKSNDQKLHVNIKKVKDKDTVQTHVKGDKLHIDAAGNKKRISFNYGINGNGRVEVYLPDKEYEEIKIKTSTSAIEGDHLRAKLIDAHVDVGDLSIKKIEGNRFIGHVGTGSLDIDALDVRSLDFNVNVGDLTVGQLPGTVDIKGKVNTGSADLKYQEKPENTHFDLRTSVGDAHVDESISPNNLNGTGEHLVDIKVNVGDVTIGME